MLGPLNIKSIVDIGCGRGHSSKYFLDQGARKEISSLHDESDVFRAIADDVTFIVDVAENKTLMKAPLAILCARSPYFLAALTGEMKEAKTKQFEIPDTRAPVMKEVLRFLCTNQCSAGVLYDDDEKMTTTFPKTSFLVCELLAASARYQVQGLKCACEQTLSRRMCILSAAETLRIADMLDCTPLKRCAMEFIVDHAEEVSKTKSYLDISVELMSELFLISSKRATGGGVKLVGYPPGYY